MCGWKQGGPARIEWVQVLTELRGDHGSAQVRVKLEIDSLSVANIRATFLIHGHGDPVEKTVDAYLSRGDNMSEVDLTLRDPALWWPNGQGDQAALYMLEARLEGF